MVQHGDSVGVLVTQSIGEPGTQLTLKIFHGLKNIKDKTNKSDKLTV